MIEDKNENCSDSSDLSGDEWIENSILHEIEEIEPLEQRHLDDDKDCMSVDNNENK